MPGNYAAIVKAIPGPERIESGWHQTAVAAAELPLLHAVHNTERPCSLPPSGSETEAFGARLRRLRRTRQLSQAQIAAALGISVPAVSAWEKGGARPRHGRMEALSRLLGVSTAELLGSDDREFSPDMLAESRAHIARIVGTTPDKVRILIEF